MYPPCQLAQTALIQGWSLASVAQERTGSGRAAWARACRRTCGTCKNHKGKPSNIREDEYVAVVGLCVCT